jgi:ribosome-binding protein aMBF1 (putative translation factor)
MDNDKSTQRAHTIASGGGSMLRIRVERLKRGWRQEDLAFYARMAAADVSRIETGRLVPYPTQVARLAKALGLKPAELLEEVGGHAGTHAS